MNWPARAPGVVVNPKTPMLLEKPTTPTDAFDVPITPCCRSDVPTTAAMFEVLGTCGPCVPEMPVTPLARSDVPCTPVPTPDWPWIPGLRNDVPRTPVPRKETLDAETLGEADDARPDVSGAVNAGNKARYRAQRLGLAVDADVVDGPTCHAGRIARCTDDARIERPNVISIRSLRFAGACTNAG